MTLILALFIYLLVWWVMLFTILPIGVEPHGEEGKGFDPGAPKFANLKKKLVLNTLVSALIVAVIWLLVDLNVIRWQEWFDVGSYK